MDSTRANLKSLRTLGLRLLHQHLSASSPFPKLVRKEHTHRKGVFVCLLFVFLAVYLYWEICVHMSAVDHRSQKRAPDS